LQQASIQLHSLIIREVGEEWQGDYSGGDQIWMRASHKEHVRRLGRAVLAGKGKFTPLLFQGPSRGWVGGWVGGVGGSVNRASLYVGRFYIATAMKYI
jgi:hypothetical protein